MSNTYSCNVNGLLKAASCFQDKCMSTQDRKALIIYARIKNLAALGGTDYSNNLAALMKDSITWQKRAKDELEAIAVYMALENAINDGATINLNVNSLAAAAKCLKAGCLGNEQLNGIGAFLGCAITTTIHPD